MGYSHHWNRDGHDAQQIPQPQWDLLCATAQQVFDHQTAAGVRLAGPDGTGQPVITSDVIAVNGASPASHEGFVLERIRTPDPEMDTLVIGGRPLGRMGHCKTQHMPYDQTVIAILVAAADLIDGMNVESDGGPSAIANGRALLDRISADTSDT